MEKKIDFRKSNQRIGRINIRRRKFKGNIIYEIEIKGTSEHYDINSKNYKSMDAFKEAVSNIIEKLYDRRNEYISGVF